MTGLSVAALLDILETPTLVVMMIPATRTHPLVPRMPFVSQEAGRPSVPAEKATLVTHSAAVSLTLACLTPVVSMLNAPPETEVKPSVHANLDMKETRTKGGLSVPV